MAPEWRQKRQHPCAQDVPVSQVAFSPDVSPGGSRDVPLRLIGCLCAALCHLRSEKGDETGCGVFFPGGCRVALFLRPREALYSASGTAAHHRRTGAHPHCRLYRLGGHPDHVEQGSRRQDLPSWRT